MAPVEAARKSRPPGLSKTVTLKGDFNHGYSSNSGRITLKGTLTITSGALMIENVQNQ
jgi:hypothetical protein